MKKFFSILLITVTIFCFSGCNIISTEKNNVGKSNNTMVAVYDALTENFKLRKKEGYLLYGVRLLVNSENVGTYTYIYTDKRPDELKYSDILIVEVNNRSGRIEKFSSPEYSVYQSMPYDVIKTAMPLNPSLFKIDSDDAVKIAAKAHMGNSFHFNYIQADLGYINGSTVYEIKHISLVNNKVFKTVIDVMTGDVISTTVEAL